MAKKRRRIRIRADQPTSGKFYLADYFQGRQGFCYRKTILAFSEKILEP